MALLGYGVVLLVCLNQAKTFIVRMVVLFNIDQEAVIGHLFWAIILLLGAVFCLEQAAKLIDPSPTSAWRHVPSKIVGLTGVIWSFVVIIYLSYLQDSDQNSLILGSSLIVLGHGLWIVIGSSDSITETRQ